MKRTFCLFILAIWVGASIGIAGDFRGFEWGSSPEELISKEGKPAHKTQIFDSLLAIRYEQSVAAHQATVDFIFVNGKLANGLIRFTESYAFKNQYIDRFKGIESLLKGKYGEPSLSREIWDNALYRDNREKWGSAVSMGHLTFFTRWKLADTEIGLVLQGKNFNCDLTVNYYSEELREELDAARKAGQSSDL